MTTTRPASNDPADVAAWEEEKTRLREEKEFREQMLQHAARADETLTHIKQGQEQHALDDVRQFRQGRRRMRAIEKRMDTLSGTVTQTVSANKYNWGVVLAWASAFVAVASVGWTMIEKFRGALAP